jgi:hypothetical protein
MPLRIQTVAAVRAKLQDLATKSPEGFVEVDTMLGTISATGQTGGIHVAVLNHRYDVFLLDPPYPGPDILAVRDSMGLMVVDLLNPKSNLLSDAQRRNLASHAANALGIIPSNIHIP